MTAMICKLRGERVNRQPSWLYDALRVTVHGSRGTAKVIACELGCKDNHVTDLADPIVGRQLKAFEIPGMVRGSGSYAILDALEAQVGRVAFHRVTLAGLDESTQKVLQHAIDLLQAIARRRPGLLEFAEHVLAAMVDRIEKAA